VDSGQARRHHRDLKSTRHANHQDLGGASLLQDPPGGAQHAIDITLVVARRHDGKASTAGGTPLDPNFLQHAPRYAVGPGLVTPISVGPLTFLPSALTLPPPMSDPWCYPGGKMKTLVNGINEPGHWNLIACFGEARLLNRADGRVELRGGSEADRTEAKEWVSLFMHEAVLRIIVSN
jgi:hypothetical protein